MASAFGQAGPSPEYQVKAVFLFNLAQFVDWPAEVFPDTRAPLVIGVLGEDPFGAYLDETVRGETVRNHRLILQRFRRISEIKTCHMLFVSHSEAGRLEQIFSAVRGRNILTVGDADDFISRGGMVRLVTERNRIRIRINMESVRAAGLTISSKLLRLAQPEG
ncbi:MAG TPA: YfiR family protein [Chthoniobacterales bacterium]|nr:YfiR family protein [Chthoniobacterales bacterium]